MKSDREFIDGIYNKAKVYEEKEAQKRLYNKSFYNKVISNIKNYHKGYRILRPVFATSIAVVLFSTGIFVYQNTLNNSHLENVPDQISMDVAPREVEPREVEPREVTPRDATPDNPSVCSLEPVEEVTIIAGEVIKLQEDSSYYAIIKVDAVYMGDANEGDEFKIEYSKDLSQDNSNFAIDERVLLYITKSEKDTWVLSDGPNRKYTFLKEEDGYTIYQDVDGAVLNTKDLMP